MRRRDGSREQKYSLGHLKCPHRLYLGTFLEADGSGNTAWDTWNARTGCIWDFSGG